MKKLISLFLTLAMILSLASVAMADDALMFTTPVPTNGTITIYDIHLNSDNQLDGVYEIYRMLELATYNETANTYSYKIVDGWVEFFTTGAGAEYVVVTDGIYVTWNENKGRDDAVVAEFAKKALAYAKEKGITVSATSNENTEIFETGDVTNSEGEQIHYGRFINLPLGYYLIDSDVGVLCGLTTSDPNGVIYAKNGAPSLTKTVKEDSVVESGTNTNPWFDHNTADIGQYVEFDVTIEVHSGAQKYEIHDKMSEGLTFVHDTAHGVKSIQHYSPSTGTNHTLTEGNDYIVKTTGLCSGNCTFEVIFTQAFCDTLKTNDKIYVSYDAKLNEKAVIGHSGNPNIAWLEYGENATHSTTPSQTITYTYGFDIIKTDANNRLIDGATFMLYRSETGMDPIDIVETSTPGVYRAASVVLPGEKDVNDLITVAGGQARVIGLDNGTYYLAEIDAPTGYNKLTTRKSFTISSANHYATIVDDVYTPNTGVQVVNSTGVQLPETGAMGTTLFIVIGSIVVLGTGVVLVTKKRMSMIED